MALQNSIYAPTPIAVNKGGTANTGTLANGQLWVGNGTATPALANITVGTNLSVASGAGTINVGTTGLASFTWHFNVTGSPTDFQMSAGCNGYTTIQSGINFLTPTNPNAGDEYTVQLYYNSSPGTGFTVGLGISTQIFQYNGTSGHHLTTTNPNGTITLLCIIGSGPTSAFTVKSTNGATFILTI